MQKYRLKFRVGDIFSPDDNVSQIIISLFMIFNDLMYVRKKHLAELEENSPYSEGRSFYLFRLSCSHLKEAVKKLYNLSKKPEFKKIYEKLPNKAKLSFEQFQNEYTPWKGSFAEQVLAKIRNSFFHYMYDNDIESALKKISNNDSEIILGEKFGDVYFNVADEVVANHFTKQIEEAGVTLKKAFERIADMIGYFDDFLNYFVDIYFEIYAEGKYTKEKI